jgi:hypothetical protein
MADGFIDPTLLKLVPRVQTNSDIAARINLNFTTSATFKNALSKLATDTRYRQIATSDPAKIQSDFNLNLRDLTALREAAQLSGADMTRIDAIILAQKGNVSDVDVDIERCCCCCCCCGETAALSLRS